MPSWPAKDPDARLDYAYTIPLDTGDAVDDYLITQLEGDANLEGQGTLAGSPAVDDDGNNGQQITAIWINGGTPGETNIFKISWDTTGGRTDERVITLAIVEAEALELTGYAKPTAQDLIDRYPAFAGVAVSTIEYWLKDAERSVDTSWLEGDYAPALMLQACHMMTLIGLGTGAEAAAAAAGASGFKRMRSGSLDLERFDSGDGGTAGGYDATTYGQQFARLLRQNKAGPRVMGTGTWPPPVPPYGVA
jgi:hypothetical protein